MYFDVLHFSGRIYTISAASTDVTGFKTELGAETVGFLNTDATELVTIGVINQSTIRLSLNQVEI